MTSIQEAQALLRIIRDRHAVTYAEIGVLLGVGMRSVMRWVAGEGSPSMRNLRHLRSVADMTERDVLKQLGVSDAEGT